MNEGPWRMAGLMVVVFVLAAAITALLLMATVVTNPLTFFRLLKFLHTYAAVIVVWTIGVVVAALIWDLVQLRRAAQRYKETDPPAP